MSDQAEINKQIERFRESLEAGNIAALMSTYTSDLIKARNEFPNESNRQTAQRLTEFSKMFQAKLKVVNDETVVSGDLAYVRGSFELTIIPKDKGPQREVRRRFLEIWRKEDGAWRVARTMDNVDRSGM